MPTVRLKPLRSQCFLLCLGGKEKIRSRMCWPTEQPTMQQPQSATLCFHPSLLTTPVGCPIHFMIQTKSSATSKACKSSELHPGWRWTATLLSLRVSQQRKKKIRLQLKSSRERLQCWCHSYTCSVNQNRLLQSPSLLDCQSSIFHKHYSHTNY